MSSEPRLAAVRASAGVYRSLEHWRGIAAMWVMIYHAIGTQEHPMHPLVELLKIPARPGWLGVHLFFVISGYCIGANVQSLRQKGAGALDFLRDRFYRILPSYWAAFGVTILMAAFTGMFNHAAPSENFPVGFWAWVGNLLLIQPFLGTKYYVIVYWTLVVEMGFYLLVALFYALRNFSGWLMPSAMLGLALAASWVPPHPVWQIIACWPEFVCGLLVFHAIRADHLQDRRQRNVYLAAIIVLGVMGGLATAQMAPQVCSPKQPIFAAAFALILYALYPLDGAICRTKALRWLGFVGAFSYSLYLIHAPFGVRVYGLGRRFFSDQSWVYAILVLLFCVLALGASYVFYRLFELRFEVWRRRVKMRVSPAAI